MPGQQAWAWLSWSQRAASAWVRQGGGERVEPDKQLAVTGADVAGGGKSFADQPP